MGLGTDIGGSIVRSALFSDPRCRIQKSAAVACNALRALWIEGFSCSYATCWLVRQVTAGYQGLKLQCI